MLLALIGFSFKLLLSRRGRTPGRSQGWMPDRSDRAMHRFIGYVVLPVWLTAGHLDYIWHRRTSIATTSGLSESLMHSLKMAGPAALGALFFEINSGVLAAIGEL